MSLREWMSSPSSDPPTFKCLTKLADGVNATVWLAMDQKTKEHVAVKVISNPQFFDVALHESNIAKILHHPNLITIHSCFKTQAQTVMLVQEYAAQGDLFNFISRGVGMDESMLLKVVPQIVDALAYLHSHNLVHRDLKPENVVVNADGDAKICDFGMMGHHGKKPTHGSGTTPYMAPELLASKRAPITHKGHDIWALGITLYVLITGAFPWLKASMSDLEYAAFVNGSLNGPWARFTPKVLALLRRMFAPLDSRCTVEDVRTVLVEEWLTDEADIGEGPVPQFAVTLEQAVSVSVTIHTHVAVKVAPRECHIVSLAVAPSDSDTDSDEAIHEPVHVASTVPVPIPEVDSSVAVKC